MKTLTFIMKKAALTISILALSLTFNSCGKDFLETMPTNAVSEAEAMSTFAGAMLAVNGIHRLMYTSMRINSSSYNASSQGYGGGISSIWHSIDHMGEDMVLFLRPSGNWFEGPYDWSSFNRDNTSTLAFPYLWYYDIINNANAIINRMDEFESSEANKNYVLGQALYYRAFAYFGLVQWFGGRFDPKTDNSQPGVPIRTENDMVLRPRASVAAVYTQINTDLNTSITLLTGNPNAIGRANKSHINANVANGLAARVALVQQRWDDAITHARAARIDVPMATADELLNGFHTVDAREWIWGMRHITEQSTGLSSFASFISLNYQANAIRVTPRLINAVLYNEMRPNDIRRDWWMVDPVNDPRLNALRNAEPGFVLRPLSNQKFRVNGSWAPVPLTDMIDLPLMRGSEMFLIEAEAEARAGRFDEARIVLTTLMMVRVPGYTTAGIGDGEYLIREIMRNRRIELWGEGHRWLDLKRLGAVGDGEEGVMHRIAAQGHTAALAGSRTFNVRILPDNTWWNLWIPRDEITASKGLVVQNP